MTPGRNTPGTATGAPETGPTGQTQAAGRAAAPAPAPAPGAALHRGGAAGPCGWADEMARAGADELAHPLARVAEPWCRVGLAALGGWAVQPPARHCAARPKRRGPGPGPGIQAEELFILPRPLYIWSPYLGALSVAPLPASAQGRAPLLRKGGQAQRPPPFVSAQLYALCLQSARASRNGGPFRCWLDFLRHFGGCARRTGIVHRHATFRAPTPRHPDTMPTAAAPEPLCIHNPIHHLSCHEAINPLPVYALYLCPRDTTLPAFVGSWQSGPTHQQKQPLCPLQCAAWSDWKSQA